MASTRLHTDKHGFKTRTPHFWRFGGANLARFGLDLAHFWCAGRGLTVIVAVVVFLRGGLDHRHGDGGGADRGAAHTRRRNEGFGETHGRRQSTKKEGHDFSSMIIIHLGMMDEGFPFILQPPPSINHLHQ